MTGSEVGLRWVPPAVLSALLLSGCGGGGDEGGPPEGFAVPVVVAEAREQAVEDTVSLVASLTANERVTLVSELESTITAIEFTDGERVEKGRPMFRLDDARTKARLAQAESAFRLADSTYKRNQSLLSSETISEQEFDQSESNYLAARAELELAREEMQDTVVRAPFSGVVAESLVDVGSYAPRSTPLATVVSLDPLEAEFDLPERYVSRADRSLSVSFVTEAYPDRRFEGGVEYIAPEVDPMMRTLRMKARIPNEDGALKPGMFGNLDLVMDRRESALVIPEAAIRFQGDQAQVVAVDADGMTDFRRVNVGIRLDGWVEITDGLEPGERVVVEGHQKLGPGMPVAISPDSQRYGVVPEPGPET